MQQFAILLICLSVFFLPSFSQITTTVVDAAGATVVQVITVDPNLGQSITQTIQTLSASPSSTPSLSPSTLIATTDTPEVHQGPVGAPPATPGAAGPTVYTYTTTDVNGGTIAVIDTFTPTYAPTSSWTPQMTGTVWDYSSYMNSFVGTNTPDVGALAQSSAQACIDRSILGITTGVLAGLVGGIWLVLT